MGSDDFIRFISGACIEKLQQAIDKELAKAHKHSAYELGVMHSKINEMVKAIIRRGKK